MSEIGKYCEDNGTDSETGYVASICFFCAIAENNTEKTEESATCGAKPEREPQGFFADKRWSYHWSENCEEIAESRYSFVRFVKSWEGLSAICYDVCGNPE